MKRKKFEEFIDCMGFEKLTSFEKTTLATVIGRGNLYILYENYPNVIEKGYGRLGPDIEKLYFLMEILKYQLETNTKCDKLIEQNSKVIEQNNYLSNQNDKLIEQNNQIIELLQKIADK